MIFFLTRIEQIERIYLGRVHFSVDQKVTKTLVIKVLRNLYNASTNN